MNDRKKQKNRSHWGKIIALLAFLASIALIWILDKEFDSRANDQTANDQSLVSQAKYSSSSESGDKLSALDSNHPYYEKVKELIEQDTPPFPDPESVDSKLAELAHGRTNQKLSQAANGVDVASLWGFQELDPSGETLENHLFGHTPVVVFNKKKNRVYLGRYKNGQIELIKSYHALYGKLPGDKRYEGDLRTPTGIYFFNSLLRENQIKRELGKMAIGMNYPNILDRREGKTGYDILLHATYENERLNLNFDSEGCIVSSNETVEEVSRFIQLGVTPILVYEQMHEEYLEPKDPELEKMFKSWLKAWNEKNLDGYMNAYAPSFRSEDGKNWSQWKAYKGALNRRYDWIKVDAEQVRYFHHPKYRVITFNQDYQSSSFRSVGTKFLYIRKINDEFKIVAEDFSRTQVTPFSGRKGTAMSQNQNTPSTSL